jgi:hypothetical protein
MRLLRALSGNPWFVFGIGGSVFWSVFWLATTDFSTSCPRTVPDRELLKYTNNINKILYGVKPGYRRINDPVFSVVE